MVERFHRTLKVAIKCHTDPIWLKNLPTVFLGLRCAIKEDLNATVSEMVYGSMITVPGDICINAPNFSNSWEKLFPRYAAKREPDILTKRSSKELNGGSKEAVYFLH